MTLSDGQLIPTPDPNVKKVEDLTAKALLGRKKTADSVRSPDQPGYGTLGKSVMLYANYLSFISVGKPVFRYSVSIAKDKGRDVPAKKARQIVRLLIEEHFANNRDNIATELNLMYFVDDPTVLTVTVGATGTLNPADLLNYLTSSNLEGPLMQQEQTVTAMNMIIGHCPKTKKSVVSIDGNRNFSLDASMGEKATLGGGLEALRGLEARRGLEALRGFFVSVRAATARVLLNVQVKYLACYQEGPLPMVIGEYQRANSRSLYRLESFLRHMRVRTIHIARKTSNGRARPAPVKSITGLASPAEGRSGDNQTRVPRYGAGPFEVQFFMGSKGTQGAPAVSAAALTEGKAKRGKKAPKAGPVTPGQYISVGGYFKRDMLRFAVMGRTPALNAESIATKGVRMLGLGEPPSATLSAFGIRVETNLITVQGRILPPPKILYAKQKEVLTMSGSWNLKAVQLSRPGAMKTWTYLYVLVQGARPHWNNPVEMMESLRKFTSVLRSMGIDAAPPNEGQRIVLVGRNDTERTERSVRELHDRYRPSLILGVLYAKDTDLYNSMKQVCDVRCGARNVNFLTEKLQVAQDQYCANVGLKTNLKLGGGNQTLHKSELGLLANGKTMLVGLDVTHPSPGSARNAPSVAAIVASVNSALAQWPAEIRIQPSKQEMVADLDTLLQSRLKHWAQHNRNEHPDDIVVYRDGVSEGQYDLVIGEELPLLKRACETIYPASATSRGLPRIAIIVVGKCHNTRFYPTAEADADRSANPMPGTVVDRGISESRHWDFFLQAHSALQGTARPAHYVTVWDEIFSTGQPAATGALGAADVLQNLTHKMCYLFGRATKAVSVCPPANYADLVCTRARCYMSDLFDPIASATPEASVVGTKSGRCQVPNSHLAVVHPNVKDTMFYI
ncbi:uncharacterized protein N7473_013170 [Penicillium subrubescens]|uniref:uncharacterized protein n=1 Tax=Penicillium subrubescens TaxID=1316194 RepID=UPI002545B7F7|nr:uncharacterized protein N7473_013170 [Penicillium subrubescens]KAJ5873611.1 hypothetical protein N7473_013170 [Penicillium subrubescens]